MALAQTALEADLLGIFLVMNSIMDGSGNDYKAAEMSKAIKKYISTGITTTKDSGTALGGPYEGVGSGKMAIDTGSLEAALKATFAKGSDDPLLASNMAADIDNVCTAVDTVTETSDGVAITGNGPVIFSGPAIGKFAGDKSIISGGLAACFQAMKSMMGGGNEYYARQMSACLTAYLKDGDIQVELKSPFASGNGIGKIA